MSRLSGYRPSSPNTALTCMDFPIRTSSVSLHNERFSFSNTLSYSYLIVNFCSLVNCDLLNIGYIHRLLTVAIMYGVDLHKHGVCDNGEGFRIHVFYVGLMIVTGAHFLATVFVVLVSTRGTVLDARPRSRINYFIYAKFLISVPEVVCVILGTVWVFGGDGSGLVCIKGGEEVKMGLVDLADSAVIVQWIILGIAVVGLLIVFDPLGGVAKGRNDPLGSQRMNYEDKDAQYAFWQKRYPLSLILLLELRS